jgi:hypothetical protein
VIAAVAIIIVAVMLVIFYKRKNLKPTALVQNP